jgi:hypothetical protein
VGDSGGESTRTIAESEAMLIATDYEILRGVRSGARGPGVSVRGEPAMVATLLDEKKFLAKNGAVIQWETVFLEDQMHDWSYREGRLRFYGRLEAVVDLLVVYATGERLFCPQCGKETQPASCCPGHG